MHPNPRRIIPVVLLLAALAAGYYWYTQVRPAQAAPGELTASGAIEVAQVQISPELSGKILAVLVEEGQRVEAGQELLRFDEALLQAQLEQARAALAQAQANYDLTAAGMPAEQRQAAVAAAQLEITSATQALDTLNENAGLAKASAEQIVAAAEKALDQANDRLESILGAAEPEDIERARAQVVIAADRLKKAREDYDRVLKFQDKNVSRAIMQIKVSDAQTAYDAAVTRLNNLLGNANAIDVALAQANVKLAEAALADAQTELAKVQNGPDPQAVALAQARLAAAQARLEAANASPTAEQLAAASAVVESARRAVETLELQLDKLVLRAPAAGVILSSSAEPGEFAMPGTPLLLLGRVDELTITIYVPEDRYGEIALGQQAQVMVDSFPGQTFQAVVTHIADKAEYTPRNVQTVEGRKNTVFAIKLKVTDPQGRLKAGMPADVIFK